MHNYCATLDLWDATEFGGETAPMSSAAAAAASPDGNAASPPIRLGTALDPAAVYQWRSRLDPTRLVQMTAKEVAEYFVVFVADLAEQMTNVMTYIDVYHQEDPARLWPVTPAATTAAAAAAA